MMYRLIILFLIFSFSNSWAQNGLKFKFVDSEQSLLNQSQNSLNLFYFELDSTINSEYEVHIQYSRIGQLVQIYSVNGKKFNGFILNKIDQLEEVKTDYGKELIPHKKFYSFIDLEAEKASEIGQILLESKAYKMPTDSLIQNWNQWWLDCGSIELHFKINDDFFHKSYSCPWNQSDSIPYVKEIQSTENSILNVLKLDSIYAIFTNQLPKGENYSNGDGTIMYKFTEQESRNWKNDKPRRDYLSTIKDTITNYLEFKLKEKFSDIKFECYDSYQVFFNSKGKFKKIKSNLPLIERIFDKDYKRCRKMLKKKIRRIKIDFVKLKYEIRRTIDFSIDKILVYDRNIY